MEKKEELLERVANEIAAQNKLIALLISFQKNSYKKGFFINDEDFHLYVEKDSLSIYKESYSSILTRISSGDSNT